MHEPGTLERRMIFSILGMILFLSIWFGTARAVFDWRHLKANQMASVKYLYQVMTFSTVPELQ
jgi:hypothetical protein